MVPEAMCNSTVLGVTISKSWSEKLKLRSRKRRRGANKSPPLSRNSIGKCPVHKRLRCPLIISSFLEDGRNTDLIRWSDEGNSFIVLDEDEFAKTLIPELFKHNNYASFVRQLNMYGFHKKVGLSDNSMRASERKNKSPSEYANPYFRRGHPELLWLIQKPKNAAASKLPKGKVKTEEEEAEEELVNSTFDFSDANYAKARPQLTAGQELTTLSQEQFETVQRELATIKQSQAQIAKMMAGLRREHEQLYGQAVTFQDQHNRHENSINAILTFLATVYNRSLQGQEGVVPGIANLFQNSIPGEGATGNIVDVGDFNLDGTDLGKMYKKQPLLLKAAPEPGPSESPATVSPGPSGSSYQGRQTRRMSQVLQGSASPGSGSVQEVFDSNVNTPYSPGAASQGRSQRDMMSVIQNANAQNSTPGTPAADFSNVLNSLENSGGRSPLTSSQRADMLRLMNNQGVGNERSNNALVNATPPSMPTNYDRNLASAKADLDNLAKLQADQEQSVQNLTSLLQPLSPTGSIPGLGDGLDIAPPPLDIDAFLSNGDYFQDFPTEGNNFETNGTTFPPFDGADEEELFANLPTTSEGVDGSQQGRVESVPSSEATTPQTIGEANFDAGSVASNGPTTRGKGRRISEAMDATDSPKRRRRNGAN